MATLKDKLRRTLVSNFPGAKAKLKTYEGQSVGGTLIWEGFIDDMIIDRQVKLRKVIADNLKPEERDRVSFIMTVTADEEMSILAD